MKKFYTILILSSVLMLCACENNNSVAPSTGDYETPSLSTEDTISEDQFSYTEYNDSNYEDVINYYERLCDMYGYQTYESVYYPELWCNYFPSGSSIYHNDWLCPEFDNSRTYYVSANPEFEAKYYGYKLCDVCGNIDLYYLDVDEGIIHSQKENLNLGTDDFITCYVNYRYVSKERAIENGFSLCECCIFE